jgi:hypothetical protein|mmetsp:Transcript_6595/g.12456  ORF Transcript_6595/g.12456 Transcript_6595/m.12456 type:complete len:100 (+) Transcript_6595:3882-4181(+)
MTSFPLHAVLSSWVCTFLERALSGARAGETCLCLGVVNQEHPTTTQRACCLIHQNCAALGLKCSGNSQFAGNRRAFLVHFELFCYSLKKCPLQAEQGVA